MDNEDTSEGYYSAAEDLSGGSDSDDKQLDPAEATSSTKINTELSTDELSKKSNLSPHAAEFKPRVSNNSSQEQTNNVKHRTIKSINGKETVQKQAHYKVYFEEDASPQWIPGEQLPSQLVTDYNIERYKRLQKTRSRRRSQFGQCYLTKASTDKLS